MDAQSTRLIEWLSSQNLPAPPFDPKEMRLIWNRQDLWARHPETERWWYLAVDRPRSGWRESTKTCSRQNLL